MLCSCTACGCHAIFASQLETYPAGVCQHAATLQLLELCSCMLSVSWLYTLQDLDVLCLRCTSLAVEIPCTLAMHWYADRGFELSSLMQMLISGRNVLDCKQTLQYYMYMCTDQQCTSRSSMHSVWCISSLSSMGMHAVWQVCWDANGREAGWLHVILWAALSKCCTSHVPHLHWLKLIGLW